MGQGKQAKVLSDAQVRAALAACDGHRYPLRDRVMILLSVRAGLRAKEVACLRWGMVTDAEGQVGDALHLPNKASKGHGMDRSHDEGLTAQAIAGARRRMRRAMPRSIEAPAQAGRR
jgi:integrase